jgi:hypothetical protein
MSQVLNDIKYAYANVGLELPKGLDIYVVDDYNRKIPYYQLANQEIDYVVMDDEGYYECNFPSLQNFFDKMDEKEFETFCRLHAGFMYEKVTKISRQIGLACNLIFDDYKSSIDDIHPYDQYDELRYDAKDLLLNKSTLSFYHT